MSDLKKWDVFISHASEDKNAFARPLAEALSTFGVKVWYDEFTLKVGDSLSKSIAKGMAESSYGIVVLSNSFFGKGWPEHELGGLIQRDVAEGGVILPIWHGVTSSEVRKYNPALADKKAILTDKNEAQDMAIELLEIIRPDIHKQHPLADLARIASGKALEELREGIEATRADLEEARDQLAEHTCPTCGAGVAVRTHEYEEYGCGSTEGGEDVGPAMCPKDPRFPSLEQFRFTLRLTESAGRRIWFCRARLKPRSYYSSPLYQEVHGESKQQALDKWITAVWNPRVREDLQRDYVDLSEVETLIMETPF